MYKLPEYTGHSRDQLIAFMQEHSFAFVTGWDAEYPVATQLPLILQEEGDKLFLLGHLMRKTDHHRAFENNNHVLALFYSPHAFINANWYQQPTKGSTINYMCVQAKGIIHFLDEAGTRDAVKAITDKMVGKGTAASFENLTTQYVDSMVKAIVGFKIEVTGLQNVFKLSQDKSEEDRGRIISQLEQCSNAGSIFIAHKMKEAF